MMASVRVPHPLPHGILASTVAGIAGAAVGWLANGAWSLVTVDYTRLDQLAALSAGATVGVAVLGARQLRQRRPVVEGMLAGAILGGVGSLTGASAVAFFHAAVSARLFLLQRVAIWTLAAAMAALLLNVFIDRTAGRRMAESVLIAAIGGAIAAVICTLPGASDLWQAAGFLWFGGSIGFAVAGPELWRASAVIASLPSRGRPARLLSLREWPLYDGDAVSLGEAQLACCDGRVALYPPAGGVVAGSRQVRDPRFVTRSTVLVVGRTRYRLEILRAPSS